MINHVEKYIGIISHGSKSDSGNRYKLNIAAIPPSPNSDLKTYITLGLSKHNHAMQAGSLLSFRDLRVNSPHRASISCGADPIK